MLVFFVGFMGCGKSTIGRRVAKRLGYDFADTDTMVEQRAGMPVNGIFADRGEEYFRSLEAGVLRELPGGDNIIIATGGGMPCHGENMEVMKSLGYTVYLKMSPEVLFGRLIRGRARRPRIAGMGDAELLEFIRVSLAGREGVYSQASMTIDCDGVSDEYITSHIIHFIGNIR